jgi:hypothetical protein
MIYLIVSWLLTDVRDRRVFWKWGEGAQHILPPNVGDNNVCFPLLSQKLEGNRPQFFLHRNNTRQVYSSQLEVT